MSPFSPYRAVLRTPDACGAFISSLVGRLCYGIVGVSLLLTLTAGGRDYGFAGLVLALFGVAIVLVSPFRAWAVDRYGPRRALPPMAAGFAAALVAIAVVPRKFGKTTTLGITAVGRRKVRVDAPSPPNLIVSCMDRLARIWVLAQQPIALLR